MVLSEILKVFTSKKFTEIIATKVESRRDWLKMVFEFHGKYKSDQTYQIWTNDNHAELIYSQKFIEQKVNYIHQNPVKNGLVINPEDYLYSSARNYADLEAVIDIVKLSFSLKTY